jgi:predicted transcriptional regulator
LAVSQTAAAAALERGKSDAAIVKRLQELEAIEKEKKRRRRLLGKSKALVKKSVKMTGRGVTQTGKLMRKTTKKTTKVAKEVTKRGVKAGVATATLDSRMMKEALKVSMKRRECKHETIVRPSNAHLQEETGKFARRLFQISFLVVALC